ncbi:hypothetical protein [Micromonospora carbonacea]|uniref:hypothetical protein n=1 Tax=Micromonospora carbonacea TaxID=47853 RepID=UPI0033D66D8B
MAKKLKTYVHVAERDDEGALTGRAGTFGPDDKLEPWAERAITNPDVWADGDEADDPAPDGSANTDSMPAGGQPSKATRQRSGR